MSSSDPAPHPSRPTADELAHIFDEVVSPVRTLALRSQRVVGRGAP